MTVNPSKLAGLHKRKGEIQEGYDADFVIWDPEATFELKELMIHHKNKVCFVYTMFIYRYNNGIILGDAVSRQNSSR